MRRTLLGAILGGALMLGAGGTAWSQNGGVKFTVHNVTQLDSGDGFIDVNQVGSKFGMIGVRVTPAVQASLTHMIEDSSTGAQWVLTFKAENGGVRVGSARRL